MNALVLITTLTALTVPLTACTPSSEGQSTQTNASGSGGAGKARKPAPKSGPDNSTATKGDGPVTWEGWEIASPIELKDEQYTHSYTATIRVKNMQQSKDEGFFTITVLKGSKVLATLDCSTATIGPGQVGTADCYSTEKFVPGWTELTVENAF